METISCKICNYDFSLDKNPPFILKNCGHSLCKNCIMAQINSSINNNKTTLKCPICNLDHLFPIDQNHFNEFFPENKLFTENSRTHLNESCFNCKKGLVCLNSNCVIFGRFCSSCQLILHPKCDINLIFNAQKINEKLDFNVPNLDAIFQVNSIKIEIKNRMHKLETLLIKITEQFHHSYKTEIKWLENCRDDISLFKFDTNVFDISISSEKNDKTVICLKNKDKLLNSANYMNEKLTNSFWRNFDKEINKLILDEVDQFIDFKNEPFTSQINVLQKLKQSNRQIVADLFVSEINLKSDFNFQNYFEQVENIFANKEVGFISVQENGLNEKDKQFFNGFLKVAFFINPLFRNSVENSIKDELSKVGMNNWEVNFERAQFIPMSPVFKKYIHLQKNGYSLCAYLF